jgi:hypothetical protein
VKAIKILTYRLRVNICGIAVLHVGALSYLWAPYMERALARKHPSERERHIFSQTIIKQIAETFLTCTRLDEVEHSGFLVLQLHQIFIYLFLMEKI